MPQLTLDASLGMLREAESKDRDADFVSRDARLRFEWMPFADQNTGLSVFVRGQYTQGYLEGAYNVFTGIKVFMGPEPKSLMRRQREDIF